MPTPSAPRLLDWSSTGPDGAGSVGRPEPCQHCHRPALCRDPAGVPTHKVCAEQALATTATDSIAAPAALPIPAEEPPMPTTPTLLAALDYAARGWPVFFLGRTKRPVANCQACVKADYTHDPNACECLTCHGFYAASTDPDRIQRMHDRVPCGLLAIRTGTLARLVVVDIDPAHGGAVDTALMPPTYCVRTGSGGWHLYYRHPEQQVTSRPMPGRCGIDIKADGGYVVAPPSCPRSAQPYRRIGDRPVADMPAELLVACQPPDPVTPDVPPRLTHADGGGISSPPALLAANLDAVARAPEGKRRTTLYGAARGIGRMVAAGAIDPDEACAALFRAGRLAGQTDRDIRAAILGGFTAEGIFTNGAAA